MDFMRIIVILWIVALITLGVLAYHVQKDIDRQRIESRGSCVPPSSREVVDRGSSGDNRCPRFGGWKEEASGIGLGENAAWY